MKFEEYAQHRWLAVYGSILSEMITGQDVPNLTEQEWEDLVTAAQTQTDLAEKAVVRKARKAVLKQTEAIKQREIERASSGSIITDEFAAPESEPKKS